MSLPRVAPRRFLRLTQVTLGIVGLNIVTGAAVRLSDSGLGCPDWPNCSQHHFTAPLAGHAGIEFGNRLVVVVVVVAAALCLVAAVLRAPRRTDLIAWSAALVGGLLAEAVLGAAVVYSKLNPYVVMTHFLVGMALVAAATVLASKAGRAPASRPEERAERLRAPRLRAPRLGALRVRPDEARLARVVLGLLLVAIVAGTATTGTGPHAGGKGAKRIPVPLDDMVRTHSGIVLVTAGLTLLLVWLLQRRGAPEAVNQRARLLLAAMIGQGVIGYTQFFTHLPPLLVGVHVFGATVVWVTALWFVDGLTVPEPEAVAVPTAPGADALQPASSPAPEPAGIMP